MLPELTDAEALRYNRQIVLRGFDFDGREKLKAARVLIAGLGGLGCAAAPYGGGRRRPSGTGGFRHRLALQPAAPDPAPRRSHRPEQSRLRRAGTERHQSAYPHRRDRRPFGR